MGNSLTVTLLNDISHTSPFPSSLLSLLKHSDTLLSFTFGVVYLFCTLTWQNSILILRYPPNLLSPLSQSSACNTGIIPTDWKRGLVVPLWNGKSDHQDCHNYQGVTLLSVPGKVFAQLILDRVRHHLLEHQHPEQFGFTPKRSTIDRILALHVLTERRR